MPYDNIKFMDIHGKQFTAGSIFRDYVWRGPWNTIDCPYNRWQRVTDPNAPHEGARKYLPNQKNAILIDDLDHAIGAEICIEEWGGHAGTSNKTIRVNQGEWISIPESDYMGPETPEAYQYFRYPVVPLELEYLFEGENIFECACSGQIAHDFGWGQWGIYGVIFRIYYSADKNHPGGRILNPKAGESLSVKNRIEVKAEKMVSSIDTVHIIGQYMDFDHFGNGKYFDWHYRYRYGELRNHMGTVKSIPYELNWVSAWLPRQEEPMSLIARIRDYAGMNYVTDIITGLNYYPAVSGVEMYEAYDVPSSWQTRDGNLHSCKVYIDKELKKARAACIELSSWNGYEADEIGINGKKLLTNIGRDHDYSFNRIEVPLEYIREGENELYTKAFTESHGIEVLWPGIVLKVEYTW